MKKMIFASAFAVLAGQSFAQDIPQKYLDIFGDMAIAATGSQLCDNIGLNQTAFNEQANSLRADAKSGGMSDAEVDNMMSSLQSNPDVLTASMMQFGARHSVAPNDIPGFCGAIKQEQSQGTRLGKMTR